MWKLEQCCKDKFHHINVKSKNSSLREIHSTAVEQLHVCSTVGPDNAFALKTLPLKCYVWKTIDSWELSGGKLPSMPTLQEQLSHRDSDWISQSPLQVTKSPGQYEGKRIKYILRLCFGTFGGKSMNFRPCFGTFLGKKYENFRFRRFQWILTMLAHADFSLTQVYNLFYGWWFYCFLNAK